MAQLKRAGWGWIWTQRARIGKERQEGETERDERDRDGNSVNTWQRPVLLREGRQSRQSREAGEEENERQKHRRQQTETGTETETETDADADAEAEAERETAAPTARDMAITCSYSLWISRVEYGFKNRPMYPVCALCSVPAWIQETKSKRPAYGQPIPNNPQCTLPPPRPPITAGTQPARTLRVTLQSVPSAQSPIHTILETPPQRPIGRFYRVCTSSSTPSKFHTEKLLPSCSSSR